MANKQYHRRSIRLPRYNYSKFGYYYVTICTQNRELYFTNNNIKQTIDNEWQELKNKFPNIDLDEYVVMPNHLHGVILINDDNIGNIDHGDTDRVGADLRVCPTIHTKGRTHRSAPTEQKPALGRIIQWFKTMTTNEYICNVKTKNWPSFNKRLWQRNYYENIIRDEKSLNRIRRYIKNNPINWKFDRNNPKKIPVNKCFT